MADIVTPYTGTTPKRTLSQAAFNSAMAEFVPFLENLPADINTGIAHIIGLAGAEWYNAATNYNVTGSTKPSFCYGTDGITYVCIGENVIGDNPVGSVTGNWAALTALDSSDTTGGFPIGASCFWDTETPPAGFMERNGAAISRTSYPEYYALVGTTFGEGDGVNTFNLPNSLGRFIRCWDHGAGVDPDAASRTDRGDGTTGNSIGTRQNSQYGSHSHPLGSSVVTWQPSSSSKFEGSPTTGPVGVGTDASTSSSGGSESRPINEYSMFCVKVFEG